MANNLMRFDPFSDLARLEPFGEIEDIFKNLSLRPSWYGKEVAPRIRMDVTETDKDYTVRADMPGISKRDIKVAIEGNQVSISAEIRGQKEVKKGETVVCTERYVGQQSRRFTLDQEVDQTKADAHYEDGVLTLTLPKKPGGTAKQLVIH
jgi:HSP20 family protein